MGREASQWTEPLQAAVAAFFVVSAVVNLVLIVGFGDLYRQYYTQVYLRAQQLPTDRIAATVDSTMSVSIGISIAIAAAYLLLAALTFFRRATWLFIVDMIVLFLAGAPSLLGGVINLAFPSRASLPQVFGFTQLVLALVALSLFILMVGLSIRYGAWAQHRAVPVPTE